MENVYVNFVVDEGYDILSVVSVLESVGVTINDVEDRKIFGEVYFTKVGPLKSINGISSVKVVGENPPVSKTVLTSDPVVEGAVSISEVEIVEQPVEVAEAVVVVEPVVVKQVNPKSKYKY